MKGSFCGDTTLFFAACIQFMYECLCRGIPCCRHEVCCSVLQCVAVRCSVLQCVAACCSMLQGHSSPFRSSVLQCVAVCCSVLQCVAECCRVLQHLALSIKCVAACCSVLQHLAASMKCVYVVSVKQKFSKCSSQPN